MTVIFFKIRFRSIYVIFNLTHFRDILLLLLWLNSGESEVFQLFKVSEIAKKLNVSRNSVYKKTSRLKAELKPYRKKLNGVNYFTEDGFKIIENSYNISHTFAEVDNNVVNGSQKKYDTYLDALLLDKDKQISQLTKMLEEKEQALSKALDLAEKTQHLLAIEKQQVLQLQSPEKEIVKKSFWDIFKIGK